MAKASREGVKFSGEKKPTLWKEVTCSSPCWQLPMGQARALTHPDDKTLFLSHSRESEGPRLTGAGQGANPSCLCSYHGLRPLWTVSRAGRGPGPACEEPREQPHSRGPGVLGISQETRPQARVALQQNKPSWAPGGMLWQEVLPPHGSIPPHHGRGSHPTQPVVSTSSQNPPRDTAKPCLQRKFKGSPKP